MSRRDDTNLRVWCASRDAYAKLLLAADRLLAEERDPAMLLAGHKVRGELRDAHRLAVRKIGQLTAKAVRS